MKNTFYIFYSICSNLNRRQKRWCSESLCRSDCGLQVIRLLGLLSLIFLVTVVHRSSMDQSSTVVAHEAHVPGISVCAALEGLTPALGHTL